MTRTMGCLTSQVFALLHSGVPVLAYNRISTRRPAAPRTAPVTGIQHRRGEAARITGTSFVGVFGGRTGSTGDL